jgi:hypothetical protein
MTTHGTSIRRLAGELRRGEIATRPADALGEGSGSARAADYLVSSLPPSGRARRRWDGRAVQRRRRRPRLARASRLFTESCTLPFLSASRAIETRL